MRYSSDVIEEVRVGNDIVDVISAYVSLKQRGGNFFGLCPFHNEKSASFSVSPDKQMYHCFGCGASGNVIGFVMQIENHDFLDAIRFLAERIRYTLPEREMSQEAAYAADLREQIYGMNKLAARFFYDTLVKDGEVACAYLDSRGLGVRIRKKYGLGYADGKWDTLYKYLIDMGYSTELVAQSGLVTLNKNGGYRDRFIDRLMFPIFNAQNKIVGFGGRSISDAIPKYLNSPDTPVFDKSKNLYGINFARMSRTRHFIIVEGYMDVISLAQAGFNNAVAALGTAFNKDHVDVLKRYADTVTLLFDSDEAGINAALRAIPYLTAGGIKTKVLQVKDAKDPDEYINNYGGESFARLLDTAVNHVAFQIDCVRKKHDIAQTDERVQFVRETAKLLASLDSEVEREAYAKETAKSTDISFNAILSEIEKLTGSPAGAVPVKRRNIQYIREGAMGEKGLRDAQKTILSLVAENDRVYRAVKGKLHPEEITEPVYAKLLQIIYSMHEKNQNWYPAEALNNFPEAAEQQKAAEIFMNPTGLCSQDDKSLEIIVTGALKRIKLHYLDTRLSVEKDDPIVRDLIEKKHKVSNLNISLIE